MGDLNSYRREDPIRALVDAGYTDVIEEFVGTGTYSFLFDGQLGYLDHALANDSLLGQITDAEEWHVNADEVVLFDYNDTIRDVRRGHVRAGVGRFSTSTRPTSAAASDHDPVVVGLDLSSLVVDDAVIVDPAAGRRARWCCRQTSRAATTSCPTVQLAVEGVDVVNTATDSRRWHLRRDHEQRDSSRSPSTGGDLAAVLSLPTTFRLPADNVVTFAVRLDGVAHVADQPGRRTDLPSGWRP